MTKKTETPGLDEITETFEAPEAQVLSIVREHEEETEAAGVIPNPDFHPILKVWVEVLKPARTENTKKVTPQWASRMVAQYTGLQYADMNVFRDMYYQRIEVLFQILLDEIATDDGCLDYTTAEEDVEENSGHYKTLLIEWQKQFLAWELNWKCTDEHAVVDLGVISEIHKMFFSDKGITAFLDQIRFEFPESDQADLTAALNEMKEASGE